MIKERKKEETTFLSELLKYLRWHPYCLWRGRIQCGTIEHYGRYIHLCDDGTSDVFAFFVVNTGIHVFLFEAKSKTGKQSVKQKHFEDLFPGFLNVTYCLVKNIDEVKACLLKVLIGTTSPVNVISERKNLFYQTKHKKEKIKKQEALINLMKRA